MKRIFLAAALFIMGSGIAARSEDAATEERLKQLNGRIEDLIAGQEAQRKQIANLARELESLREQQGKPNASYAAQDDLKQLWVTVKEIDRKRIEDSEKVRVALDQIKKALDTSLKPPKTVATPSDRTGERDKSAAGNSNRTDKPEKGFEYTIQSGDTLSAIITAYKDKGIKITEKQIMAANPALVPEKMKVGQKIWIPAPTER